MGPAARRPRRGAAETAWSSWGGFCGAVLFVFVFADFPSFSTDVQGFLKFFWYVHRFDLVLRTSVEVYVFYCYFLNWSFGDDVLFVLSFSLETSL